MSIYEYISVYNMIKYDQLWLYIIKYYIYMIIYDYIYDQI